MSSSKRQPGRGPRISIGQRRAQAVLASLIVLMAAACSGSAGISGNDTTTSHRAATTSAPVVTTAVPPPAYPGRLLILALPADGTSQATRVMQLTSTSFRPAPMTSFPTFTGQVEAISSDNRSILYQAPDESLHVVGPDIDVALPDQVEAGALSPDGTKLAYSSSANHETSLYVHDIAAGTDQVVLKEPCAYYSNAPGDGKLCGSIAGEIWIDPTTLFVVHYAGDMPGGVRCQPGDPVTLCYPIPANRYSLVGTDARLIASMSNEGTNAEVPAAAHGSTVVLDNGTWIDLDQMRSGSASIRDIPASAEVSSLSPDGTKVVVPAVPGWKVTVLRTGESTRLGTPGITPEAKNWNSETVVWSPDGRWFAVQSPATGVTVIPVSAERGGPAGTVGAQDTLFAWKG